MFEQDPQGHRKKDHIFKEFLVGRASATMEFWIRAGLKKRRAAGLVADTLARAGYRLPGGRPLSWRTIDGWRNRVIGRADVNLAARAYRRAKDDAESTQLPWQILAERAQCMLGELVRHQNLEKPSS
jgi:hypothetical protein